MSERFPDLPSRMKMLPVDKRGFPVPWFVAWINGEPHFPVADGRKFALAWNKRRCWVCGGHLGRVSVFVIGPMCAVNRTSSEPPSHLECARFSARNCPFLTKPRMKRVGDENLPCGVVEPGGTMIRRNPGVALAWQTLRPSAVSDGKGGIVFDIGKPHAVEWYAEGRVATREEVEMSIATGLPLLEDMCLTDPYPEGALAQLDQCKAEIFALLPPERLAA